VDDLYALLIMGGCFAVVIVLHWALGRI